MNPEYKMLIDGNFLDSTEQTAVVDPSTGEIFAHVPAADERHVEQALAVARNAFDRGPWPRLPLTERRRFVAKIAEGIFSRASDFMRLETLNTGKPIKETTFMDVPSAAKTFEYFSANLERLLAEEPVDIPGEAGARLLRQPRGVVVLIAPWNYPLLIASWKMAQSLAAGNTVILKPATLTPLTALELGKIAAEAGLPAGVVNVVTGSGERLGRMLCGDQRVDMVSFTGSPEVGARILGYTARSVKKSIMELGGKSAGIVLEDADLEVAVNGSLCSIFLNQGQMCTALSRILVAEKIYDKFLADFSAKARKIRVGPGMDYETQMGPLISRSQRDAVLAYVEEARQEGARLVCGGRIPADPALQEGFFFEPAVLTDVPAGARILREEVFGPVVCVGRFSTVDEAVALANDSDYALASAVWSKNTALAEETAGRINAGITWVNTYGMFYNQLPYGGFGKSGFGKELGREGFLEYTRLKSVITDKSPGGKPLVNFWYGL